MTAILIALALFIAFAVYAIVNAAGVKLTREHLKDNPDERPDDLPTEDDIDDAVAIEY